MSGFETFFDLASPLERTTPVTSWRWRSAFSSYFLIAGSLWIMADLNDSIMPPAELMNMHGQHTPNLGAVAICR
jgi:hypothetical protein